MNITKWVQDEIDGRLAMITPGETDILIKYASLPGDQVELGCLWGGSAIIAGLAKLQAGVKGHVYTVDFMTGGYWVNGDPGVKLRLPSHEAILGNVRYFGVEKMVSVIKAKTHPWPLDENIQPKTVLIDAGHSYEACLQDWKNVSFLKPDYVLFHDYDTGKHPGVKEVVDKVVKSDPAWRVAEQANTMIVFERQG
jgi:hypothetical protein